MLKSVKVAFYDFSTLQLKRLGPDARHSTNDMTQWQQQTYEKRRAVPFQHWQVKQKGAILLRCSSGSKECGIKFRHKLDQSATWKRFSICTKMSSRPTLACWSGTGEVHRKLRFGRRLYGGDRPATVRAEMIYIICLPLRHTLTIRLVFDFLNDNIMRTYAKYHHELNSCARSSFRNKNNAHQIWNLFELARDIWNIN